MKMKSYKALGPNGFQPIFYKMYWSVVREDVWRLVANAFRTSHFDERIVVALLVLIPKIDHPVRINKFQRISLCNVVHKLISKVIVASLQPYLSKMMSPLQSNFVPRRGITNNAIMF
uniref:Transposon TX1 uncharacterized n=1 Tax=Cajanus cajan TaxID=3821 RepID=A0A151RNN8_CAJCA|nr:Transposon TX1 uncharacterized [Cajanus cajan]